MRKTFFSCTAVEGVGVLGVGVKQTHHLHPVCTCANRVCVCVFRTVTWNQSHRAEPHPLGGLAVLTASSKYLLPLLHLLQQMENYFQQGYTILGNHETAISSL